MNTQTNEMAKEVRTGLIVDDDQVFRQTLKRSFEKRGIRTIDAGEARIAIDQFRQSRPDVVVLDYRMPERDGLSLLREMHSDSPASVFVILTGFGNISLAVESMKEGADTFLSKPIEADKILSEAARILQKKRQSMPGIGKSEARAFSLEVLERQGIERALEATEGNVSKASVLLGIDRRTLQRKMKRYF